MKRLFLALATLLLLVVILLSVGVIMAPRFGWHLDIIYGRSMEPAMKTGSVAVIQPVAPQDIQVGDIITYKWLGSSSRLSTHRVVEVMNNDGSLMFTTKGDANEKADLRPVPPEDVVGRLWISVPYMGYAMDYMKTPLGFGLVVGIPAALIIGIESRNIFLAVKDLRRKGHVKQASK
ncbi:Signal peptidase I W [subsurface metagenome]